MARWHSGLYRGELVHARHDATARRAFRYSVYVAALDLGELPALDRELWLFSHRGKNLFAFDDRDYAASLAPSTRARSPRVATADRGPSSRAIQSPACGSDQLRDTAERGGNELRDTLAALRAGNGLPAPATTRLVTNLRVAGYVFNPVSFFLDYDAAGTLTSVIAEVNNTYGGRFRYVLGPGQRIAGARAPSGTAVGFRHVRELFVSPFLHGPATYDFWFPARLDPTELVIEMHVHHAGHRRFTARLVGTRTPLSDRALAAAAVRYPLMTAQVIGLIHLEALKLRLAGVPYRRPTEDHRPLDVSPPHG